MYFFHRIFRTLQIRGIATPHFWQFSIVARDLPQKFRLLRIETSVKTFNAKSAKICSTTAIKF